MLKNTGHEEISLSSLSSSDYSASLPELVTFLIDEFDSKGINISLPSLRIDAFSLDVMSKVQDIRKSSLTFAPEAGSQRLRDVINKGLTEEIILEGAGQAFEGGWNKVKLYFMLGLPDRDRGRYRRTSPIWPRRLQSVTMRFPKTSATENVRLPSALPSSCRSPSPRSSGRRMNNRGSSSLAVPETVNHEDQGSCSITRAFSYNWHEADVSVLGRTAGQGETEKSQKPF